jgi:hypothetical protein
MKKILTEDDVLPEIDDLEDTFIDNEISSFIKEDEEDDLT